MKNLNKKKQMKKSKKPAKNNTPKEENHRPTSDLESKLNQKSKSPKKAA